MFAGCGSSSKGDDASPLAKQLVGEWHLVSWNGAAPAYSMLTCRSLPDKTFEIYQQIEQVGYQKYTGSYLIGNKMLSGKYSDNTPWGSSYEVSFDESGNTLTLVSDRFGGRSERLYARFDTRVGQGGATVMKASSRAADRCCSDDPVFCKTFWKCLLQFAEGIFLLRTCGFYLKIGTETSLVFALGEAETLDSKRNQGFLFFIGPPGIEPGTQVIFSPLLHQLSYGTILLSYKTRLQMITKLDLFSLTPDLFSSVYNVVYTVVFAKNDTHFGFIASAKVSKFLKLAKVSRKFTTFSALA